MCRCSFYLWAGLLASRRFTTEGCTPPVALHVGRGGLTTLLPCSLLRLCPAPYTCIVQVPMLEDSFAEDDLLSGSTKRLSTNLASTGCEPLTTFPEEDDGEELDEFEALCISQGLLTER